MDLSNRNANELIPVSKEPRAWYVFPHNILAVTSVYFNHTFGFSRNCPNLKIYCYNKRSDSGLERQMAQQQEH